MWLTETRLDKTPMPYCEYKYVQLLAGSVIRVLNRRRFFKTSVEMFPLKAYTKNNNSKNV